MLRSEEFMVYYAFRYGIRRVDSMVKLTVAAEDVVSDLGAFFATPDGSGGPRCRARILSTRSRGGTACRVPKLAKIQVLDQVSSCERLQ